LLWRLHAFHVELQLQGTRFVRGIFGVAGSSRLRRRRKDNQGRRSNADSNSRGKSLAGAEPFARAQPLAQSDSIAVTDSISIADTVAQPFPFANSHARSRYAAWTGGCGG
jgi:hypothetical protein